MLPVQEGWGTSSMPGGGTEIRMPCRQKIFKILKNEDYERLLAPCYRLQIFPPAYFTKFFF